MAEWIYFIHPPRDDFAATMTAEEEAAWGLHFERSKLAAARQGLMARSAGAVLLAVGLAVAGCSSFPPQVACNGVEPVNCQRIATKIIAQKREEDPSRPVIRVEVTDGRGGYTVTFDDGTGESMIVD